MAYDSVKDINWSEGFDGALHYVNNVSDSWFVWLMLIAIYFIIALNVFRNEGDFLEAMSVAGLITYLVAALLWLASLLDGISMMVATAVFVLGFILLWSVNKSP